MHRRCPRWVVEAHQPDGSIAVGWFEGDDEATDLVADALLTRRTPTRTADDPWCDMPAR